MAREASEGVQGETAFGGSPEGSWVRVRAPYKPDDLTGLGLSNKPGGIILESVSDAGVVTSRYIWLDSNGLLHSSATKPTDQDETTSIVAPKTITVATVTLGHFSVLSASTVEVATTLAGVAVGDLVVIESTPLSGLNAGLIVGGARVSGANTIHVRFTNPTVLAIHPGAHTFRVFHYDLT